MIFIEFIGVKEYKFKETNIRTKRKKVGYIKLPNRVIALTKN